MKKRFLFIISFIFIIFLVSCNKTIDISFDNDINVYNQKTENINDLSFEANTTYKEYNDHVLELDFSLKIINNKKEKVNLKIFNPTAFGNDEALDERVLISYDYNNKENNKLFDELSIKLEKEYNLNLYLVIKDGNPLCKYDINLKINNKDLDIYSYKEDYKLDKFFYVHNPNYSDSVLADAEYDEASVFGYKPSTTGSLKSYAKYDWTNKNDVYGYKQERIKYIDDNDKRINTLETKLKNENKSIEEIAKACSNLRNEIRLEQYKDDPEGLAAVKQRNLEKYGHEEGPLPEELYVKYNNSWEMVLEKCYATNRGMDACCGVYDMYYYLYNDFAY